MSLTRDIDSILKYGAKATTYKYATLLAIFDYIVSCPSEVPVNNFHFLPLVHFAKQFVMYYYPFSFSNIAQGRLAQGKQARIINYINEFREEICTNPVVEPESFKRILAAKEDGFKWMEIAIEANEQLPTAFIGLLAKIRKEILEQPLAFLHNVEGEVIRFFGIVNKGLPFISTYEAHLNAGMKTKFSKGCTWDELMRAEDTLIIIDDLTYKELASLRFWGREVIIKAWLDFLASIPTNSGLTSETVLHLFDCFYSRDFERDAALVSRYKNLYTHIGATTCIYSGHSLVNRSFHLDHFLPWIYYPVNRFWNLVPSEPKFNLEKSAHLPKWTPAIEARVRDHLTTCLAHRDENIIQNDLAYLYNVVFKRADFNFISGEPGELLETVLVYIKSELKGLGKIIPGVKFDIDLRS